MGFSPGQSSTLAVLQRCANGQVGLIGVILDEFGLNMMNDSKLIVGILQKKRSLIYNCYSCGSKKGNGCGELGAKLASGYLQAKAHPAEHLPPWPSFLGYVRIPLLLMAEIQQWPVGGLVPFLHLDFCSVSCIPGFQVQV